GPLRVEPLHQPRLAAGHVVGMEDALLGRAVEPGDGRQGSRLRSVGALAEDAPGLPDAGFDRRAHRPVAERAPDRGPRLLLRGGGVSHASTLAWGSRTRI